MQCENLKEINEVSLKNPQFTKEMKNEYTILAPNMLPIHFKFIADIIEQEGYNVEILNNCGNAVVEEGLKSVHNDTCYPALLTIGQMIDALKSGKYDLNKTALFLTQTGGGCRASNYLVLLKKALKKNNLEHIPVVSLNFSNLFAKDGLSLKISTYIKILYSCFYADLILWLQNQTLPYEINKGETQKVIDDLVCSINKDFKTLSFFKIQENYIKIVSAFNKVGKTQEKKVKVGIVGEIYMKYSPLGNNNLSDYLINQGAEPVVTGVLDFLLYCFNNDRVDTTLYRREKISDKVKSKLFDYVLKGQNLMKKVVSEHSNFTPPSIFTDVQKASKRFINQGVKMGEGWLLTGEMIEFLETGVNNIISAQPFGCLPNHIVAKGMIRSIKTEYPEANIIAIDYDPGASQTNQENRIKLMLSRANANHSLSKKDEKIHLIVQ